MPTLNESDSEWTKLDDEVEECNDCGKLSGTLCLKHKEMNQFE